MTEKLLRKVALGALKGERGEGGWLKIDAPEASDKEISLAIMEADGLGIVKGCDVSHLGSRYPEWRLIGPTALTGRYARDTRFSKKLWLALVSIGGAFIGFAKWVIPILLSVIKR